MLLCDTIYVCFCFLSVKASQVREDEAHLPPQLRGDPGCNLPPGCKANYGATHEASPFIQVRLPRGFKHLTKASRAVSYFSDDGPNAALANSRFTRRSLASAKAAAQSWVWEW